MVWTRRELKNYAKAFLRKHYWKAFIVCLIFSVLTGSPAIESQYEFEDNTVISMGTSGLGKLFSLYGTFPFWLIGASLNAFIGLVLILISIFVGPLITVGKNRFFLNAFKGDVSISNLFSTFNSIEFWGIFKCIFITNLKNFLWTLLFIIPGIIKAYEYSMVPYLLTKDPYLSSAEAIEISRSLTDGHKLDMFILDLSFWGWYLLGLLFFGIGMYLVIPYEEATKARLYNVLSGNDQDNDENYKILYE